MAISVNWGTKVITVPRADMTLKQSSPIEVRELDLNWFRLQLKDLEDSAEGMASLDTHRHNTEVSIAGLTLARVVEIINGYTVTFEDGQYAVQAVGANSNLMDVLNPNQVSVRSANSAGLIVSEAADVNAILAAIGVAILDNQNTEIGLSVRNTLRVLVATAAGRLSGLLGTQLDETVSIMNALADSKIRVVAVTDKYGNRKQVTLDLTD